MTSSHWPATSHALVWLFDLHIHAPYIQSSYLLAQHLKTNLQWQFRGRADVYNLCQYYPEWSSKQLHESRGILNQVKGCYYYNLQELDLEKGNLVYTHVLSNSSYIFSSEFNRFFIFLSAGCPCSLLLSSQSYKVFKE